jgi:hypothetical protein
LGTVVYQFFPTGKRVIIDGISWRFPLLGVLNAIYVHVWATRHYVVGMHVVSSLVAATLIGIFTAFIFALFVCSAVTVCGTHVDLPERILIVTS